MDVSNGSSCVRKSLPDRHYSPASRKHLGSRDARPGASRDLHDSPSPRTNTRSFAEGPFPKNSVALSEGIQQNSALRGGPDQPVCGITNRQGAKPSMPRARKRAATTAILLLAALAFSGCNKLKSKQEVK